MVISAMTETKARMWMGSGTGLRFKQSGHKRGHLCTSESGKRARTGPRWELWAQQGGEHDQVRGRGGKSDIRDGSRRPVGRTLTFL